MAGSARDLPSDNRAVCVSPQLAGPGVLAGLTTRVGFPSGDDASPEDARGQLRAALARELGRNPERFAWAKQVHGKRVFEVTQPGLQGEGDALVCTDPSIGLLVVVADCCPVLLWDESSSVFAVSHAGWRGLVAGVLRETLRGMAARGAALDHVRAWVGPSIGACCFEVGEEVAAEFDAAFVTRREGWPRPHVDLRVAARAALASGGMNADRVELCPDCTSCHPELYFSYRRDGGICGRHVGYLLRGASAR